jgi:hypothetical protein
MKFGEKMRKSGKGEGKAGSSCDSCVIGEGEKSDDNIKPEVHSEHVKRRMSCSC